MHLFKSCQKAAIFFILLSFLLCPPASAAQQPSGQNTSAPAAAVSNADDTQPPTAPGKLSASYKTCTSVTLSWNASIDNVGVKGYQIFRDGKKILSTSKTTYTNMDLVPGRVYTYAVKAYDGKGNVSESGEPLQVGTLSDTQSPTAPASPFISSADHTSIALSWKPSSDNIGVKGYVIHVDGLKKITAKDTSCTCKGLTPGKTYRFTVKAYDAAGNYSAGTEATGGTVADTTPPSAPYGLKSEHVSETEVTIVWASSADNVKVKKYEIYSGGTKVGSLSKTSWTARKLPPGKSITYSVRAVDSSGLQSPESLPLTVTTRKDLQNPTVPGNLKINSLKDSSLSLSWDASTDNTKLENYQVYCNGSMIATTTRTTRSVKIPSGIHIGIYWVRACDISGNLSPKSNTVTAVTAK